MKRTISGIYLVIDPAMTLDEMMPRLKEALVAGVEVVQIWDHWQDAVSVEQQMSLIAGIREACHGEAVPVLMNENWRLAKAAQLDGVHFDQIPKEWPMIRQQLGADKLYGITCGNDLSVVRWAENQGLNYLSFCAMFPSPSVATCELVNPEMVRKARELTSLPIFLSGGMNVPNILKLRNIDFQGVAVISGIMSAPSVTDVVHAYKNALKKHFLSEKNKT